MPRTLSVALVLAGVFVRVLVPATTSEADKYSFEGRIGNAMLVHGLHVALPGNMKNFPTELVPLP